MFHKNRHQFFFNGLLLFFWCGGLEDHFPFFSWVICRFQPLIFQGVVRERSLAGDFTCLVIFFRWKVSAESGSFTAPCMMRFLMVRPRRGSEKGAGG